MPEDGLAEAAQELEGINDFYRDRAEKNTLPPVSTVTTIKSQLQAPQFRESIVLEE
jgi:hypothetical protein